MTVHNVAPHDGGVEFSYTIDWETPLNIAVDITVFDPPELVWHDEWGQDITPRGWLKPRHVPRSGGQRAGPAMNEGLSEKDAFELYENGKHRRYGLLFAVNGGAFAIAKLLAGEVARPELVLGGLRLWQLSLGMVLFTAVMVWDIFEFGRKMRNTYLPDAFGPQGRIVLLLLGGLIGLAWILVSLPQPALPG